jgi:hypothetical protein
MPTTDPIFETPADQEKPMAISAARAASEPTSESVSVTDQFIVIDKLIETDPVVVRHVGDADEPVAAIHEALQVGARCIGAAGRELDTRAVHESFTKMTSEVSEKVDEASVKVGEDGTLAKTVATFGETLNEMLGKTFDPASKESLLGRLESVLGEARLQQVDAIRRLIDPADGESPMGKVRNDIMRVEREQNEKLERQLIEISEKIAVSEVRAEMAELGTQKGVAFEDAVHEVVSHLVEPFGDLAEPTGTAAGATGAKKGDEVVTLAPDTSGSSPGAYVIECKNRKLSMPETRRELTDSMANRNASAGIAIFKTQDQAPGRIPFQHHDNQAIAVFDPDEGDTAALRLALMWARWVVQRSARPEEEGADLEAVEAALTNATNAVRKAAQIRANHTKAVKSIEEAGEHLKGLEADVSEAIAAARSALRP